MATAQPIQIGLIGAGRAGWGMHCEELAQKESMFRIVAACDLIDERRRRMAERYGCKTYERLEELVVDPEVELVDIATRSCAHFAHARLALEAGKDVFLEKPMCANEEEAKELVKLAHASKGNLYIRHNRRFEPAYQHIREIIASGILGNVYEIKLRRVSYHRRDDWQTLKTYGGGQLLNWGPHIIDHALRLLESPVADMWSDIKRIAAVGDAEDHIKIVLTGKNGRIVDMEISGGAAISEPEYLVWGTKGALSCTGDTIHMRYQNPEQPLDHRQANPGTPAYGHFGSPETVEWIEETLPVQPKYPVDMTTIWDELYKAIRLGFDFPVHLEEALSVMQIISRTKADTEFA